MKSFLDLRLAFKMSTETEDMEVVWAPDTGDTAFMIIAACLVLLMTPGLAFFYGGLVSKKTSVAMMFQNFVSMGVTSILWWVCGYSLAFSGDHGGIFGDLNRAFGMGLKPDTPYSNGKMPELVFYVYQMAFAIVTPALITGAFAGRVRFKAYLVFIIFWMLTVYIPWCHWVWGGGWAAKWGVLDFAGGIVVHCTAGIAALASVIYVGPRHKRELEPHSLPLVAIGTGLLWFGWYGFNAGSQLSIDGVTALAFFNTDLAGSAACITWMIIEWGFSKKPKFLGMLTGAVAGLATITPCAGFVDTWAAFIIGFLAGVVCWCSVWVLKTKLKLDDALDVFGVHGIGGIMGTILLGFFADPKVNPAAGLGVFYGGGAFLGKQIAAISVCVVHSFVFTYALLFLIDKTLKMKITVEEQQENLDAIEHGEHAYVSKGVNHVKAFAGGDERNSIELKTQEEQVP